MKRIIIMLFLYFSVISYAAADSRDLRTALEHLSENEISTLLREGEITRYFYKEEQPSYILKSPFAEPLEESISALDIKIGVESLFYLEYGDAIEASSVRLLSLYNIMLSIQTMEGIEYYSHSRKKMRTLFTKSHEMVGPADLTPVPDPVVTAIPPYKLRYLFQTDNIFGSNIYRTEYHSDNSTIWVNMTNVTTMKYFFIPMLQPEKMSVNLFIQPLDEGLLFYGLCAAETTSLLGLEKTKKKSFYNRIKAMYNWFADEFKNAIPF